VPLAHLLVPVLRAEWVPGQASGYSHHSQEIEVDAHVQCKGPKPGKETSDYRITSMASQHFLLEMVGKRTARIQRDYSGMHCLDPDVDSKKKLGLFGKNEWYRADTVIINEILITIFLVLFYLSKIAMY
jgi:hypothetical protein